MNLRRKLLLERVALAASWIAAAAFVLGCLLIVAALVGLHGVRKNWLPNEVIRLLVAIGGVFAAAMALRVVLLAFLDRAEHKGRLNRALCPSCGYDMAGISMYSGCPECGWAQLRERKEGPT